jgi:hypothetical protein
VGVVRTLAAHVVSIPIGLVEPHPKLMLRFSYDVASLASLIRSAVDEMTPNGQLEPGWVVPRQDGKEGYHVYIGIRRYKALTLLYKETGDERFAKFNAYVDAKNRPLLDLFVRARKENEDARGERQGLSVLEQVFGLYRIRDSVSTEKLDGELKREFDVAEKLSEEKVRKLFQVEIAAHFRFRLAHLERLCAIGDEREFYQSAACAAGFDVEVEQMDSTVERTDAAYTLDWFKRLFPEFKEPEKRPAAAQPSPVTAPDGAGGQQAGTPAQQPPLEVHEKDAIIVACPACGGENMLLLSLNAEVTRLPADPRGTRAAVTPDAVIRCEYRCNSCPKEFYVFLEPMEGRSYAADASLSPKFREPKDAVQAVDLRIDTKKNAWQKIVEGKVVGTVGARLTEVGE